MKEVWKPIEGYEGLYEVSDQGRVRSLDRYVHGMSKTGTPMKRLLKGKVCAYSCKCGDSKSYRRVHGVSQ